MHKLLSIFLGLILMASLSLSSLAVDSYHFASENTEEFYVQEPNIEHTIIVPELDAGYGLGSERPKNSPGNTGNTSVVSNSAGGLGDPQRGTSPPLGARLERSETTSAEVVRDWEDVRNKDGSIGVLKIPKIGLTVTAYDGDTFEAMKKGIGHIASTSLWNSNIGLTGHNRGVNANFGRLKDLKIGDEMTYTTKLGTRTYAVVFAGKIPNNDWSYLQYTTDNRLTLITCVADQPEYRYCVQAAEKK